MSDRAKPDSDCTGLSDCSLSVMEIEDIAMMRPDLLVDYLRHRSAFDAAAVERALQYAVEKAKIDLAANTKQKSACYTTSISICPSPCKHLNGTYRSIPARWFGRRTVFVCRDCESVLNAKTKQVV